MAACHILCVDDDVDTCASMSDILTDFGYPVRTASNGASALALVRQDGFGLALLDFKMPDMNGLELFRRIRQMNPRVDGVLVTAFASGDVVEEARRDGVRRVLAKPVNFDDLLPLVEAVMGSPGPATS